MRVSGLHIEGFGHFQGFDLRDLSGGLTVLHGPNEAGKSTLLQFLLHVLFGPEGGRRMRPRALAGGRLGGRLEIVSGLDAFVVERLDGAPVVVRERGRSLEGEDVLRARLQGADRSLFRAVFGFSLADLAGLEGLGDAAVRDRLFSGALIGAGRSVTAARAGLAVLRGTARACLGIALLVAGRLEEAEQATARAIDTYEAAGDRLGRAHHLATAGAIAAEQDDLVAADALLDRARDAAPTSSGRPWPWIHLSEGFLDAARERQGSLDDLARLDALLLAPQEDAFGRALLLRLASRRG